MRRVYAIYIFLFLSISLLLSSCGDGASLWLSPYSSLEAEYPIEAESPLGAALDFSEAGWELLGESGETLSGISFSIVSARHSEGTLWLHIIIRSLPEEFEETIGRIYGIRAENIGSEIGVWEGRSEVSWKWANGHWEIEIAAMEFFLQRV